LIIPMLLALTVYIVITAQQIAYAVLWPGLTNGSTYTINTLTTATWGYYAGFGKMTISFSGGAVSNVYVAELPIYTFASQGNLSLASGPIPTSHGTYLPCGRFGLIVRNDVVIPVAVQVYSGIYTYVPTNALNVPLSCYQQWASQIGTRSILTFDGTWHTIVGNAVYVKAYKYSSNTLVQTGYLLYTLSQAKPYTAGTPYGTYGNTNVTGVWYLQMVNLYVGNVQGTVTITLVAQR